MVKAIRHVKDACINEGSGMMDFVKSVERIKPDIFVVNEDGDSDVKRTFCEERGIEYVVLKRVPDAGLEARSTTAIRTTVKSRLPFRLDLAGTWIDQPHVSKFHPGWALTISLEPTIEFEERCGMSTSTRNAARKSGRTSYPIITARCWPGCFFVSRTNRTSKNTCPEPKTLSESVSPA